MLQHGIDLHKRSLTIATLDDQGALLARRRIPARRSEVRQYFRGWEGPQRAAAESTGSWYWLADLCEAEGVEFHLAHAHRLQAIAQAKVKTDAVDAHTLAQLLRADLLPESHMVASARREQRDLLRARLRMVQRRTGVKNSVARIFEKYNVSAVERLPALAQIQVAFHQAQIALLTEQARGTVQLVSRQHPRSAAFTRLLQIPGIGVIGALGIALEVDDVQRFASERHFFSYCRLVPGASDSGPRRRHKASKAGNRYLKVTFSHAAVRAIQHYPTIRAVYQRITRKKNRFIARALVAKELARIVYYVLTHEADYNNIFKGQTLSTPKQAKRPRRASPESGLDSQHANTERVLPRS